MSESGHHPLQFVEVADHDLMGIEPTSIDNRESAAG